ncbi:MAG: ParB/RepB/Spo0J family partition protein [Candidatus Zixiibacteriota bacterium]
MSKIVLGKGLEALIPGQGQAASDERSYQTVSVDRIAPNPMQPRRDFDEDRLLELASSIKEHGIMQPLVVRREGSSFTIIAGERRYRAARLADMEQLPVIVIDDVSDDRLLELALVENVQREDLNPIETAEAYRTLMERCSLTQQQMAERLNKSRSAITNCLRLLTLPDPVKKMIRSGQLSEGHARALMSIESEEALMRLAQRIVSEKLSVRSIERQARRMTGRRATRRTPPELVQAESSLKQMYGTSVKIHHGLKRGHIEIEYYGNEDLERLLDLLYRANR